MKTVLVKPNTKASHYGNTEPLSAVEMPIWLLCLANCYDRPVIVDAEADGLDFEHTLARIQSFNPERVVILATGSHPSAHIQQKEASHALASMIKGVPVEVHETLPLDPICAGRPNWTLLGVHKYRAHNWHCWGGKRRTPYASLFTSVSCPYNCDFCCIKSFYKTDYKLRPIEDVIQDVKELYYGYGVRNFKIMDELFVTKSQRVKEICYELSQFKDLNIWSYARIDTVDKSILSMLRKAGITWLAYGIESGNDEIRKDMMKGSFTKQQIKDIVYLTKDCGINVLGNYMFGFRKDTYGTMQETFDFAQELNCEYANFYCVVAYPGSPLYDEMKAQGVALPERAEEYAQMSPNFRPLPTETVPAEEVLKFRDMAFKKYFKNVAYLDYMEQKFGIGTVEEILDMNSIEIKRKHGGV